MGNQGAVVAPATAGILGNVPATRRRTKQCQKNNNLKHGTLTKNVMSRAESGLAHGLAWSVFFLFS